MTAIMKSNPYPHYAVGDKIQVSEHGGEWKDFDTISTPDQGRAAIKLCNQTGPRVFRVVSENGIVKLGASNTSTAAKGKPASKTKPEASTPAAKGKTNKPTGKMAAANANAAKHKTKQSEGQVAETIDAGGGVLVEVIETPAEPSPSKPSAAETARLRTETRTAVAEAKAKAKEAAASEKKLSALDAAAKVLEKSGKAMNCQELVTAMREGGLWTSPGGKTPAATLHAAISTEIRKKGAASRFAKAERGKFKLNGVSNDAGATQPAEAVA